MVSLGFPEFLISSEQKFSMFTAFSLLRIGCADDSAGSGPGGSAGGGAGGGAGGELAVVLLAMLVPAGGGCRYEFQLGRTTFALEVVFLFVIISVVLH